MTKFWSYAVRISSVTLSLLVVIVYQVKWAWLNNHKYLVHLLIATVLVRDLNWLQPHPPTGNCKWSEQDLTTLSLTDFVIAGDGK